MKLHLSIVSSFLTLATTVSAQDPTNPPTTDALTSAPSPTPGMNINAFGTELKIIKTSRLDYDQNQNGIAYDPTLSSNSIKLEGNGWYAYPLPDGSITIEDDTILQFDFTLNERTVDGFQSICLDNDREYTNGATVNGRCFVLDTTQGWIKNSINVAQRTNVGETTTHKIPIGAYLNGDVSYIAFLQDSDGDAAAKLKGNSTFSNIQIKSEAQDQLEIEVHRSVESLNTHDQYSYDMTRYRNQDTKDWRMEVTEEGTGIQINGNQWKALALNSPYNITHYTMIELEIVVSDEADFHSIGLDNNLEDNDEKQLVSMATHQSNALSYHTMTTQVETGVSTHVTIPYGSILGYLEGEYMEASYLVFAQDMDVADKRGGRSTYSQIKIYEREERPIMLEIYGDNVTVPNIQDRMTESGSSSYVQDSLDHDMSVSLNGKTITAYGNNWRRWKLPDVFEVTTSTMISFTANVVKEEEKHMICLLKDTNNANDGRNDCFAIAGKEVNGNSGSYRDIKPHAKEEDGPTEYQILVGSHFTGAVHYIGIAQDNDKAFSDSRASGETSWSDIKIYNLPEFKFDIDGETFAIENNQQSYDQNQDSTPIRDKLMEISQDGLSITTHGNQWRAMPVEPPIPAANLGDFVVSFDFKLSEHEEISSICFEDNKEFGDYDDPNDNKYDPKRCRLLYYDPDEDQKNRNYHFEGPYEPGVDETYHFVTNMGKLFERFNTWNYLSIVADNDQDKTMGEWTISNLAITTDATSCLQGKAFSFDVSDCTVPNFLAGVKGAMDSLPEEEKCAHNDPLVEMMALGDYTYEHQVYKEIEYICKASYENDEYDFIKSLSSDATIARQIANEMIDGGTVLNSASDSNTVAKTGAGINAAKQYETSHLFTWPQDHHALDQCDVGAAMCCWVDQRGASDLVDNTDVCYVNMKDSKKTAHVADGYSIYGDDHAGNVNCHGFVWDSSGSSISSALKGNALFKVGFLGVYDQDKVEQVPGAPLCGCIDRMPVVTQASCTEITDDTSSVSVSHHATMGFSASFNQGEIATSDCNGNDLKAHYKTIYTEEDSLHLFNYIDNRLVGDGNCHEAINDFLGTKGLAKAA